MTPAEARPFLEQLVILGELFDAKLSDAKKELYFRALEDLPLADVVAALNAAAKTRDFMPRPAELRRLIVGEDEDRAEQAWMVFREAMRRAGAYVSIATADPALGETILAMFGSWPAACRAEFSPEMWSSKRKEFGRIYHALTQRQLPGVRYLVGVTEQENAGRVEWVKYTTVAVLEGPRVSLLQGDDAIAYRQRIAALAHQATQIGDGMPSPKGAA